ncbi:MAG: gliding motility protein GldN [Saprospiraceae bacterium]
MKNKILLFILIAAATFQNTIIAQPLDDIVKRTVMSERQVLEYPPLREADIMWEKRIWRVIDTREKMNQPFRYPKAPFLKILQRAAMNGDITLYSTENDQFSMALTEEDQEGIFFQQDTIEVFDPDTQESYLQVVTNELNWEDVNRFRVKEVWFFDTRTSTMRVRILGIAPLVDVFTETGEFRNEKPLYWAYYPELRELLAREEVYTVGNDAGLNSWEDLFERRFFSSYIYKESNVGDNRLKDITTGVDLLLEADKIKQEIFNYEHDLWSY